MFVYVYVCLCGVCVYVCVCNKSTLGKKKGGGAISMTGP